MLTVFADSNEYGAYSCLNWSCHEFGKGLQPNYHVSGQPKHAIVLKNTHEGLVLDTYERNGRDDSDFFAIVWNEEKQAAETIEYASTRGWSYPCNATIDATSEVKEAYNAWAKKQIEEAKAKREAVLNTFPSQGKRIVVVAGRKVPKGTQGVVFWTGECSYKKSYYSDIKYYRIGFKDDAGKTHWTSAENVAVIHEGTQLEKFDCAEYAGSLSGLSYCGLSTWRRLPYAS